MKKKSIKKNYIYNLTYQLLSVIIPLITTPYLSRVLGASGIGIYSFASSVVTYFVLFATLGTATYGQREISYVQDNREKRTEVFWNTEFLSCISTFIILFFYTLYVIFFSGNVVIYTIFSMNIIFVVFDITWLYRGMEEFGQIVFRNIFFKIVNVVLIFLVVQTEDDIGKYVLIMCLLPLLGVMSLWSSLFKIVDKPDWKKIKPFTNINVVLSMFIPTIAISIYTVLDKTMLGVLTGLNVENGYYEQALKLSRTALSLVTALGTVIIPRIGYHYEKKETEIVRNYMYRSYRFVWFLGIPLSLGMIAVAPNVVPWFYGDGFDKVIPLLGISSLLIIAIGINNVTGMQYLIPTRRQNVFTYTVLIGAVTNFILNFILIPKWYSVGAAFASVLAETVIAVVQIIIVRKEISPWKILSYSRHYLVAGFVMYGILKKIGHYLEAGILNSMMMIIGGGVIYFLILLILKDDFFKEQIVKILKR
ncbi:MAG: oligosaccharide flippase family protein [Lachnospiraceae bacterium]|nr:oligosaccharide flippase family protein [Lachnospiraceae bacterium]